jgi:hypothetical protein
MRYLPIFLLAASTAFSQATPQPPATLIEGLVCYLDKHDPSKVDFPMQAIYFGRVSAIDGERPTFTKERTTRADGTIRKVLVVRLTPGEHTVQIIQSAIGTYRTAHSKPATARFTAVSGHTYSADVLFIGHERWIPLIYDETDNRMVSLPKPPSQ